MICIQCRNKKLEKIVDIGNQVISSLFYAKPKYNLKKYPLDLYTLASLRLDYDSCVMTTTVPYDES